MPAQKFDFKPTLRLNVYGNADNKYYLETEIAEEKDGIITFSEAVPFRTDHLKEFAETIIEKDKKGNGLGVFPEDLLYIDKSMAVIYQKPTIQQLKFSKGLKVPNGKYPLPGLIFILEGYSLYCYAYQDDHRPDDFTQLFKAPFYNTSSHGWICMGNNSMSKLPKLKNLYDAAYIARTMFFDSTFTHYSDVERLKGLTLEELYRNKKGIIPKKAYKAHGKNLKQRIENS